GGMGTTGALIEDNLIEWCGWADAERGWEAAGAKFHRARDMMFRRNVVRHMRHANAVWWDSENANCRITGNIFADVLTVSAAVHMEMNREANQIDNNIIWDVRNAEPGTPGQRGCAGSGLFINATDKVTVAHNLIGRCDNSGIFAILRPDRKGSGQARDNAVVNNIFARCGTSAVVFLDPKNTSDGNVYADMPQRYLGFYEGDAKTYLDLASWRAAHGWDKTSVEAGLGVAFDAETLRLTLSGDRKLPTAAPVKGMQSDLLGAPGGEMRVAGPLANLTKRDVWQVDPRRL
ncbi:MAG: right-handed parallel beta-helix repeat-containing protein, partial [Asticcacaulis sp.]